MRLISASVPLLALALAGCAGDPSTQLPGTTKILDELPRVQNSPKAPCWLQEQVAAQNSYVDSIKASKEIAYVAPCKAVPTQTQPRSASEPKTS
jgi:hypothetical protein